jgi:hypothetical protein
MDRSKVTSALNHGVKHHYPTMLVPPQNDQNFHCSKDTIIVNGLKLLYP